MEKGTSDIFNDFPKDLSFQKALIRKSRRAIILFNVVALMFLAAALILIIVIGPGDNIPALLGQCCFFVLVLIGIIQFVRYKKFGWYTLFIFDVLASIFSVIHFLNSVVSLKNNTADMTQGLLMMVLIIISFNSVLLLYKKRMRLVFGIIK